MVLFQSTVLIVFLLFNRTYTHNLSDGTMNTLLDDEHVCVPIHADAKYFYNFISEDEECPDNIRNLYLRCDAFGNCK